MYICLEKELMEKETAQLFFENFIDEKSTDFFPLQKSGSERINFLGNSSKSKFIITYNRNIQENEAFFYFSNVFSELNLNTPKVFKINPERNLYVQQFLGDKTLFEIIQSEGESNRVKKLVKKSIEKLFLLQEKTREKIDYTKCFEYEVYDEIPILHDLYYFKNYFIDILEIHYHKASLLKEFKQLTFEIENTEPKGLMLRDFQSRNIMVKNEDVFFIDYQSAMKGPVAYDLVSFLYQAKANFSQSFRDEMFSHYISLHNDQKTKEEIQKAFKYCQLIRFLQVLGAYGFRGIIQKKPHFVSSIKNGIENIYNFSNNWEEMDRFPTLQKVIHELISENITQKIKNLTQ